MDLARVIGCIVATQKDPALQGCKLCVIQPLDQDLNPKGSALVATDSSSSRGEGEIVYYVSSGDAVPTGPEGRKMPVDAAIVGIVDYVSKA
ncbi:MAG TPA: EutN/CcmL family microcompartment protein [Candidatus Sumerlaeota bacterium]|nr:MAG: Carbon dioxide concentrating mechanism protein CcmL [candidate division BRC1 bacterium ADurb.Bin183]HOE64155.1 EutN/CcmL family microcompartment protein [Candidatus Sumerlaeota bacterium]HRR30475.1 EutN/CcmL family microcompartment protein [Candidatus Sumerlaeia bacterium]HON51059.1 EutN/CcmL family microcompartment protein [Candidatus Sumerlaeota bacterium]HOR65062.1 EutN/CcmL family microcompartment protein [Candidatus Sumerlaeota bacterium]